MLSWTVPLNSTVSCSTTATWSRSHSSEQSRASRPSISTRPADGVEEARDQRAERRLPHARRPHQRDPLTRPDVQRDVAQHRPRLAVAERDVLERDVALRAPAAVGVRRLREHVVGLQQLGDPVALGHRRRDLRQLAREVAHRALRLARVAGEHEQLAGADRAVGDADGAHHEHERGADRAHRADQPVEARLQPRDLDPRSEPPCRPLAHALALVALGAERLDDRHRRQRFVGDRRDLPLLRAPHPRLRPHAPPVDEAEHAGQRRGGDRDDREHRVDHGQHDGHPDRQQRRLDHRAERLREQVAHRVHVAGHARDQVALLALLVEAEREPLQVLVDAHAQVVRDALAGRLQPQVGGVLRARLDQRDGDRDGSDRHEQPHVVGVERERGVAMREQAVDQQRERPRLGEIGGGQGDGRTRGAGERLPAAQDVRAEHAGGR